MQNKQLWALIVGMGLVSGGALAQQPPRQESPEVTAAEMEAMKEAAAAGGTGSVDGFGETYGEQVEREQDAIEAAAAAAKAESNTILAPMPQDSTVDYGSIADAIFSSGGTRADQKGKAGAKEVPKVYEDIIMTLVEPTSKTVLGMGHTIDIKLRAGSNLKWNFDKEYKSLEFISERTEDGFVHAVFKAKEPGRETVYFDCLDVGDPLNVKVLETKLISVKVE